MHLRPRGDAVVAPLGQMCQRPAMPAQGLQTALCGAAHLRGRCSQAMDVFRDRAIRMLEQALQPQANVV